MIKKEWREVSRQSLYFVLAMAGMVLLVGLPNWLQSKPLDAETVIIMLGLMQLMFSMFLGLSPFALDSKQKGMEYLLTLPFSRGRLLFIKLLPRLIAVILFYSVFFLLYGLMGSDAFSRGFTVFSLSYFSLFFISLSLSVIHENFIVQSIWAGIALCGYLMLCSLILALGFAWSNNYSLGSILRFGHFGNSIYDSSGLIMALIVFSLMLAPFVVSYFLAIKKFDLRPARAFNRRQLLFFVPLLLLALAASLGVSYQIQKSSMFDDSFFYLMESGQLLKTSWPGKLTVYYENGRKKIDTGKAIFWNRVLLEKEQQLFLLGYDTEDGSDIIVRVGMKDSSWKTLYRVRHRYLANPSYFPFSYDGTGFVRLQRSLAEADRPGMNPDFAIKTDMLELVTFDPLNGKSRTIMYRSPLFKGIYLPQLFGCDQIKGLRFWLISSSWSHIFRLWEDGRVDALCLTKSPPAYYGGLLFSPGSNSLQVRRLLASGSEKVKEIDGEFTLIRNFQQFFKVKNDSGEMYVKRNKRIVHLDLATLAIDDVGPDRGLIKLVPPGDFYYVENEGWPHRNRAQPDRWRKIYRLQGGKMVFLKQFDLSEPGQGHVWVGRSGIYLREKGRTRIFAFPDLQELKFKKLN
jgi:hypothetical protein